MAYSKTTWEDLPSTNTPITASNLNKIENQVYANTNDIATNTTNIATNTSDIDNLETTISNLGTYTTATGTYTTATWSAGTNTCTWTAPKTGVYLIFARFQANDYSAAQPYKQLQLHGTATRIMGDLAFWQDVANSSFVEGVIVSMPVYATQGQTVIPYVHTDTANKVWNMTITGVLLK